MKRFLALLPAAALCCANATAETPRLSLWITDTIGATDARQCAQAPRHARVTQRIDEGDVAFWDPATAVWSLNETGQPARERARQIADRCFILRVDGQAVASGVALWSHSARRVSMPVLGIAVTGNSLSLRIGFGQGGPESTPVASERLNDVLAGKPASGKAQP